MPGWFYPVYGISYFLSHSKLQKPLLKMIVPSLAISGAIVVGCFALLYLPTAAVLSVVQLGPLGFVTAVSVVLSIAGAS